MLGRSVVRSALTFAEFRQLGILSIAFFFVFSSHFSHADTAPTAQIQETKQKISEVETYIRQQTLQGANYLPASLKNSFGWFSGRWHAVALGDDVPDPSGLDNEVETSNPRSAPFNLASNFHHKGFLPTHDTMTLGMSFTQNVFGDKMQLIVRPFYGQGWTAFEGYWGGELSMNIAQRPDGAPFGSLALDYVEGNSAMTDHGRGIDLHGDIDLTHNFKFTSGVKQSDVTGNSNYALIKWGIHFK